MQLATEAFLTGVQVDPGTPVLVEFVASRRASGRSWRLIARDLEDATGFSVTEVTLRSWFPELVGRRVA